MVSLTKNYVFTAPFMNGEPTNKCTDNVKPVLAQIYDDPVVLKSAERMKKMFLERKECLLHGDLHTASVMCTTEGKNSKVSIRCNRQSRKKIHFTSYYLMSCCLQYMLSLTIFYSWFIEY
jgi:hypothetical protein